MDPKDFYVEDEPLEDVLAAFASGNKHKTRPPWYEDSPETRRIFAEEVLTLAATELIFEAMHEGAVSRPDLAERLGIAEREVALVLSGKRDMNLRELAAMLHVLGFQATLGKTAGDIR